tara:strand:- start:4178 stop:4345 length:168 start_codon:yes stop_codon:yes gene_type:complete
VAAYKDTRKKVKIIVDVYETSVQNGCIPYLETLGETSTLITGLGLEFKLRRNVKG